MAAGSISRPNGARLWWCSTSRPSTCCGTSNSECSAPVLRQNLGRRLVVDLSALIRREFRLDDHPLAPRASTPPVPLRRPPPARCREPCLRQQLDVYKRTTARP